MLNFAIDESDTYSKLTQSIRLLHSGAYRRLRISHVTADQRVFARAVLSCIEGLAGENRRSEYLNTRELNDFFRCERNNKKIASLPIDRPRFLIIYDADLMTLEHNKQLEEFALDPYVRIVYITGDF